MDVLNYIEVLAAVAGAALSILLFALPRFGTASRLVALILVPAFLASAIQAVTLDWLPDDAALLCFAFLILCAPSGCVASYTFARAKFPLDLTKKRWFFVSIASAAPLLIASLYVFRPPLAASTQDLIALGPPGYVAAGYLILISVVILGNVEQTLRGAEEHVLWEIKFLLLGIASIFAAIIYIASQVLLYPPRYSFLPLQALRIFPIILICACLLILQSWRRSTGKSRVVVSHGVVHSAITLFSVAAYLVATSLVGRWVSVRAHSSIGLEPAIFLISAIVLAALLLGTALRHRARRWIRRNLFAGNYDYRRLWMDATEKVRSIDSPAATATALAQLVHDALGSLEISVWLRARDADVMRLAHARGTISESLEQKTLAIAEIPPDLSEPVAVGELREKSTYQWPSNLFNNTKASLIVPLISSGRLVGLLTVGSDRSGRDLDPEAREFLRVLARHAASEVHKYQLLEHLVETREAEAFQTFSTFLLHDLKNFASTLSLIAKNAVRHHGNPDFQQDAFGCILDTAEKMKHLCNGLRTFSTSLAANKRLDDLNDIVREVAHDFDSSFSRRLKLDLSPIPNVEVDRQDFSRVLQNLILNANEAAPNGPIELTTLSEPRGIVITVVDKGKGIPKEFLERELFLPFHSTKSDGLGIGLFQSKKIVEAHDGTIEVESKDGEGTLVRIVIPQTRSEQTSTASVSPDDTARDFAVGRALGHAAAKN